jgi:hypothetical protein
MINKIIPKFILRLFVHKKTQNIMCSGFQSNQKFNGHLGNP